MPDIMWLALLPMGHVGAAWRLAVSSSITNLMLQVWHSLRLIVVISTIITNVALTVTITVVVRIRVTIIATLILRRLSHGLFFALLISICILDCEPVLIKTIDIIRKLIPLLIFFLNVINDIFCLMI